MSALAVRKIQWASPEGDAARAIRFTVFVNEQKVPGEMELDAVDAFATHFLVTDHTGHAVGTGRLFADPANPGSGRIGRMAVLAEWRGKGVGAVLVKAMLEESRKGPWRRVVLDAQTHAVDFYARFGFVVFGEEHMDAGIPHRMMELVLKG